MSTSDSDAYEEEEGPNEYDYTDGFVAPDEEDSAGAADSIEDEGDVGETDLNEEEQEIYRQSLQPQQGVRRSRRRRRSVERYLDPDYHRLMSDNGRDTLPDDEEVMVLEESDDEYQPERNNDFSMDEASEASSEED